MNAKELHKMFPKVSPVYTQPWRNNDVVPLILLSVLACAHCNKYVAPAVQDVVEDLIVICDKNKKSPKDIESNQWTLIGECY